MERTLEAGLGGSRRGRPPCKPCGRAPPLSHLPAPGATAAPGATVARIFAAPGSPGAPNLASEARAAHEPPSPRKRPETGPNTARSSLAAGRASGGDEIPMADLSRRRPACLARVGATCARRPRVRLSTYGPGGGHASSRTTPRCGRLWRRRDHLNGRCVHASNGCGYRPRPARHCPSRPARCSWASRGTDTSARLTGCCPHLVSASSGSTRQTSIAAGRKSQRKESARPSTNRTPACFAHAWVSAWRCNSPSSDIGPTT
jgi:hypothetical protein